jgi:hypothetical protein
VGKTEPVDRCTYDPWGPTRIGTLETTTAEAPRLWGSAECRATTESAQAALNEMRRRHNTDSEALRTTRASNAPIPEHHCCSDTHTQTLADIAVKLHSQLKRVKAELAAKGTADRATCTDLLRQAEIDLQNLASKVTWDLQLVSQDPRPQMSGGPYHAITTFDVGTNPFTSLCSAIADYEACVSKTKSKKR